MPDETCVVPATVHGRYLVKAPEGEPVRRVLVGFHGYGQNAQDMLTQLERVPGVERWRIASVQGLSRFYDRRNEKVVASWMTREDRELAMADNVRYVADVVSRLKQSHPVDTLVYAGFSQGVAMAYRAAARAGHACHGLIALGGDVPPDVREDPGILLPPVLLGRGRADDWYRATTFGDDAVLLKARGVLRTAVELEAGHEWTDEFRQAAGSFLGELAG